MGDDGQASLIDALLAAAHDAVWILGREGQLVRGNDAFARLRSRAGELWPDVAREALSGRDVTVEGRLLIGGSGRAFVIRGTPMAGGGAVLTARDVTGQHVIERKGVEWTLTFDAIELPIFITAMDGVIRRLNRAARDLAGSGSFSALIGKPLREIGQSEPWVTIAQCIDSIRDSEQPCTAQAYQAESDRTWDIAANWYRNPDDGAARAIVALRETTTIVRLQESVRRGEQLAALGELVAGVAHEVRNPLWGMQLTLDALEDADAPAQIVADLRHWLRRLNALMESLLAYGRAWTIDLQRGSVGEVVRQAVANTRSMAEAAGVTVAASVGEAPPILMDPSRLAQAFENLITNAVQHSDRGRVLVEVGTSDGFVECLVSDDGPGFPPADLPRLFQPFFTRRAGGTGLGLSIVQRVVDEHGGTIALRNREERGALVTLRFPVY
jgi:signal transduction histidine kinase